MGTVWITFLFIPEPLQPSFLKQKMMRWGWETREMQEDTERRKERQRRPEEREEQRENQEREAASAEDSAPTRQFKYMNLCPRERLRSECCMLSHSQQVKARPL